MHIANTQDRISFTFQLLNIITNKDNCLIMEIRNCEFRKIQLHWNENRGSWLATLQSTSRTEKQTFRRHWRCPLNFWSDKKDYKDFGNDEEEKLISYFSVPL